MIPRQQQPVALQSSGRGRQERRLSVLPALHLHLRSRLLVTVPFPCSAWTPSPLRGASPLPWAAAAGAPPSPGCSGSASSATSAEPRGGGEAGRPAGVGQAGAAPAPHSPWRWSSSAGTQRPAETTAAGRSCTVPGAPCRAPPAGSLLRHPPSRRGAARHRPAPPHHVRRPPGGGSVRAIPCRPVPSNGTAKVLGEKTTLFPRVSLKQRQQQQQHNYCPLIAG